MKQILIYGAIVLFLVSIVWLATTENNNTVSAYSMGTLTTQHKDFDFGTILMDNGNVSHNFEVTNDSEEAVIIKKVSTSCSCTTAKIHDANKNEYGSFGMHGVQKTNIEVKAGESVIVEAIYDPAAHGPSGVGLAQRSIYVETNSSISPKMELRFEAMVTR